MHVRGHLYTQSHLNMPVVAIQVSLLSANALQARCLLPGGQHQGMRVFAGASGGPFQAEYSNLGIDTGAQHSKMKKVRLQ